MCGCEPYVLMLSVDYVVKHWIGMEEILDLLCLRLAVWPWANHLICLHFSSLSGTGLIILPFSKPLFFLSVRPYFCQKDARCKFLSCSAKRYVHANSYPWHDWNCEYFWAGAICCFEPCTWPTSCCCNIWPSSFLLQYPWGQHNL